ncbi:right-handed parallel beta-helix repeat-containing protein [Patescibacteria group bacterium]|nr:right-handed parallel beta-helix repeat-containing protein [Patescibacteria group bacterium]
MVNVYNSGGGFIGGYVTIQAGINACPNNGSVVCDDGIYTGAGNKELGWTGKKITVKSLNGASNCIIDCQNSGRGFCFEYAYDCGTISGFTIRNGYITGGWPSGCGGGILCTSSSPTITNCIISGNNVYGDSHGGGIACYVYSSPTITNCIISGNNAYGDSIGGGIFCSAYSSPTITNCIISGNNAYGGGGIFCYAFSSPTITNCIISGNVAYNYGGGIACINSSPSIDYNDVWNNSEGNYWGCSAGSHDISADPQFVSSSDYHLKYGSPCINAGSNTALGIPLTDFDGNPRIIEGTVDMGVYECIYIHTKDANGIWLISDDFKAQLNLLQGAKPIWEAHLINTPDEKIDLISIGTLSQQAERELHTFMSQSCNLSVVNDKGQWNEKGFWQNTKGIPIKYCYPTTQGSIYGADRGFFDLQIELTPITICKIWKDGVALPDQPIIPDGTTENTAIITGMTMVFDTATAHLDEAQVGNGYFANRVVFEENIRVWKGFEYESGGKEFIPAFTGMIDKVSTNDINGKATISAIDYNKKLAQITAEKVTMDGSDGSLTTKLNVSEPISGGKGLTSTATKIPVLAPIDKWATTGKIKIDDEVISYVSIINTTDDKSFNGCIRGADLTTPAEHNDGTIVENWQWHIAPRMDRAVEALVQEAGLTDYQIDPTITEANFEHFSYHGKTPSNPPFGVARCMCYDSDRDQYWFGIDDKLYLWKDGVWTDKGKPEEGSYIYQIAVWESNGNVYFVTCSKKDIFSDDFKTPASLTGTSKLWKYNVLTETSSAYADSQKPMYGVGIACHNVNFIYWRMDSRKGFVITNSTLFFCFDTNPGGASSKGIACLSLTTDVFTTTIDYNTIDDKEPMAGSITLTRDDTIIYATGSTTRKTYMHSINTSTLAVTLVWSWNYGHASIPEIAHLSTGEFVVLSLHFYAWWNGAMSIEWDNRCYMEIISATGTSLKIYTYREGAVSSLDKVDDVPRSIIPDCQNVVDWQKNQASELIFFLGTDYQDGTAHKLYRLQGATMSYAIADISLLGFEQKGASSNLLLIWKNSIRYLFGISFPAYILWQYSENSVITAFNTTDFRANYGVTAIDSILKNFAMASGFLAYFDELGRYYFVKPALTGDVIVGFVASDITELKKQDGNLADYPIINKAIAQLFDGTNQIYELDPTHESRVKFGLETTSIGNEWLNNAGVAYGLAKELVTNYCLPKSTIEGDLRWYPILNLNRLTCLANKPLGIWYKPIPNETTIMPTVTTGNKWRILEMTESDRPPSTSIRVRQI